MKKSRKERKLILADYLSVKRDNDALRGAYRTAFNALTAYRERVEEMTQIIESQHELAQIRQRIIDRHEQYEAALAKMVGDYAIGVGEPISMALRAFDPGSIRMELSLPLKLGSIRLDSNAAINIRTEVLKLLEVEAVRERMSRITHCRISLAGNDVGYTISDSALNEMPIGFLASKIGQEIATELVKAIRNPKVGA
jgi:hypothetical protein